MSYMITEKIMGQLKALFTKNTFENDDGHGHSRTITIFAENVPEAIQDAFKKFIEVDDYHYEWMSDFVDSFIEAIEVNGEYDEGDIEDIFDTIRSEIEADIYTGERLQWLASNLNKMEYVTDVLTEIQEACRAAGSFSRRQSSDNVDCEDLIGRAQAREKDEVCGYCKDAMIKVLDILCEGQETEEGDEEEQKTCDQCGEATNDLKYLEGAGWCCPTCFVKYE